MNQTKALQAFWFVAAFWVLLYSSTVWIDLLIVHFVNLASGYKVLASVALGIPLSLMPLPKFESLRKAKILIQLGSGLVLLSLVMLVLLFALNRNGASRFLLLGTVVWGTMGIWCLRIGKTLKN